MSAGTMLFLSMRVLHVLLAAIWLGATFFVSFLLMPAVNTTGAAGGQVMISLNKRIVPLFASLAGLTVLTGIYLYWRFTGGFDAAISRSNAGMAFGIGGVAGLLAAILGGSVVGRSSKKVVELMQQAATLPDGRDVVVRLGGSHEDSGGVRALVKELVRRTAAFVELRQFNPDMTFRIDAADIVAVHKVMGEAI